MFETTENINQTDLTQLNESLQKMQHDIMLLLIILISVIVVVFFMGTCLLCVYCKYNKKEHEEIRQNLLKYKQENEDILDKKETNLI